MDTPDSVVKAIDDDSKNTVATPAANAKCEAAGELALAIGGLKEAVHALATNAVKDPITTPVIRPATWGAGAQAQKVQRLKADLAKLKANATWDAAGELAKKILGLEGPATSQAAGAENELIARMQDVGNAVTDRVNDAKAEAIAAEAERDNAEKATSKAQATRAANEAQTHKKKATEQADWTALVVRALDLALSVIPDAAGQSNAKSLKAMAEVGKATASQAAVRAQQAADGAQEIANTA